MTATRVGVGAAVYPYIAYSDYTYPTGMQVGDLITMELLVTGGPLTAPTGWTVKSHDGGAATALAYHWVTGSEGATTGNWAVAGGGVIYMMWAKHYRNSLGSGDPFSGTVAHGNTTAANTASMSLTTTHDDCLLVMFEGGFSVHTITAQPSGMTSWVNTSDYQHASYEVKAVAGASGAKQATLSTSVVNHSMLYAVRSAPPPAVVAIESVGLKSSGAAAGTRVPPVPSGVASGNGVMAFLGQWSATVPAEPTDFDDIIGPSVEDTNGSIFNYWKIATGADTGTYSVPANGSANDALAARFTGFDAADPFLDDMDYPAITSGTTVPTVSLDGVRANSLLLWFIWSTGARVLTVPAGWTRRSEDASQRIHLLTKVHNSGGSGTSNTGSITGATVPTATFIRTSLVALQPVSDGGAPPAMTVKRRKSDGTVETLTPYWKKPDGSVVALTPKWRKPDGTVVEDRTPTFRGHRWHDLSQGHRSATKVDA